MSITPSAPQAALPPVSSLLGPGLPVVTTLVEDESTQLESSRIEQCNICSSTQSYHWYKDPKDPTLDRCQNCYLREQKKKTDRQCATCHVTEAGQWYKDASDPTLDRCRKCYIREQKKRIDRECATCQATSSDTWYKDPKDPTLARCIKCYKRVQAERTDRECTTCDATSSSRWYKDSKDPTLAKCSKCYNRAQVERTDRTCATCQATSSSKWYKDPNDSALAKCVVCYRKCHKRAQEAVSNKKQKLEKPIPAANVSSGTSESTTQLGAPVFIPSTLLKDVLKLSEAENAFNPSSFASGLNSKSL